MSAKVLFLLLPAALIAAAALGSMPATPAHAEAEPLGFQDVTIWLYPEYDDPRLLVMIEGDVVGVDIPATVRFLVPADAEMYSAGSKDDFDQYTGGPPRRQAASLEGWDEISYEVTEETFRVEYYAPLIEGYPDKVIAHESRFLYPVSDLVVIVQQPYASTDFSVTPAAEGTFNDGTFENHEYTYTVLGRDEPLNFHVSYNKLDTNPSLTILGGTSPGGPDTSSDPSSLATVIAGAVIGAAVLVSAGAVWIKRSKPKKRPAPKRAAAPNRAGKDKPQHSSRFCTMCGQPVDRSHRFCPGCGSKLT